MMFVEKIIKSVETATGLKCYYQSAEEINRIFDYADHPSAHFFLIDSAGVQMSAGNIRERVQVAIFFCDLTEFDFNSIENEKIIEQCKERAFRWLDSLSRSPLLRLVSVTNSTRVYNAYDSILTGFALNCTLEELKGICTR